MGTSLPTGHAGAWIARARLERLLGRGGGGEVWEAHTEHGPVALKLVAADASFAEARAVARLSHPGIVQIFGYGRAQLRDQPVGYLSLRLAQGSWATSADATAPPRLVAQILEIASALGHAHARGLLHLDVKPGNILLCEGRLVLADFGIAHRQGEALAHGRVRGSLPWMSPEALTGRWRDLGPSTDLYALGVVAWQRLTGRLPFPSPDPEHTTLRRCAGPPAHPERWPGPLKAWFDAVLAPHPADRFPDVPTAMRALEAIDVSALDVGSQLHDDVTLTATASAPGGRAAPQPPRAPRRPLIPAFHPALDVVLDDPPPRAADPRLQPTLHALRELPLVGRERHRRVLASALVHACAEGTPAAIALVGPAGTGKSRLARWLCERAGELGCAEIWRATCTRGGDGVLDALRHRLTLDGLEPDAIADRISAALGSELAGGLVPLLGDQPTAMTPEERRSWLARAITAATRPVILWLDDAHLSPSALRLTTLLLASGSPVLVLLTLRSDLLDPAGGALDDLQERGASLLQIGGLAPLEHQRLIDSVLHLDGELASEIGIRSGHNPLFTLSLLGDWSARGLMEPGPHGWRLQPGVQHTLPSDLLQAWHDRLQPALEAFGPDALERAAVLGPRVHPGLWRAVSGLAQPEHDRMVSRLLDQGVLVPRGEQLGFTHELVREALLRHARDADRLRAHHAACAGVVDEPEALGIHWMGSGQPQRAATALGAALSTARASGDGERILRIARALEDSLDAAHAAASDRRRLDAWLRRSEALRSLGHHAEAAQLSERARDVAEQLGDLHALSDALRCHAGALHRLGQVRQAAALQARALELSEGAGLQAAAIESGLSLGQMCFQLGEPDRGEQLMRQARARCDPSIPAKLRAQALAGMAYLSVRRRDHAAAVGWARSARRLAESHGWLRMQATVAGFESGALEALGRHAEALSVLQRAAEILSGLGSPDVGLMWAGMAMSLLHLDRAGEAAERAADALDALERAGRRPLVAATHVVALWADCARGAPSWQVHLTAAERLLEETGFAQDSMIRALQGAARVAPPEAQDRIAALLEAQRARLGR